MYLRRHGTLAQVAAGLGIAVGASHAYTTAGIDMLANRVPGLLRILQDRDPDFVLLGGTLAERNRVGDGCADYSAKCRRHPHPIGGHAENAH